MTVSKGSSAFLLAISLASRPKNSPSCLINHQNTPDITTLSKTTSTCNDDDDDGDKDDDNGDDDNNDDDEVDDDDDDDDVEDEEVIINTPESGEC